MSWLACIWFLVCPSKSGVYHAQFLFGTGRGWGGGEVTVLVEVRSVVNQQDLEASIRCLPELEARMFPLFSDSPL